MQTLISSKPYKQWCEAKGIDFGEYIRQFPFVVDRLTLPKKIIKKLTLGEKIKNFFKY